ncbi:maleylpyruvate isomerase family mycothiol-dependent enzyme [Ruania halotolerans]|uniref:maleylpyruvate isomerase family mycothiol-dependent enzyme n=1 Tax=Ruania halotolerans TaxID=2897773 RepID=UPI001E4E7F2E|nr:maleylpyruvate isomerase family mycothiol-dependent enzyme [Ruania halotolerans]UFU07159.1 maleylpyruvate isomerase family mycothiol-dependent enzyme [Ruania halotolerans]
MVTLTRYVDELHDQWELLRGRLDDVGAEVLASPSSLPEWTVGDLVAHLGRALDAITAAEPDPTSEPVPLADYLSGYADDAAQIDRRTKEFSAAIAHDPLGGLDATVARAFAHLDTLAPAGPDAVIRTRRGPITVQDFVISRLVELVVHGYDLAPAMAAPVPVDAGARELVAQALVDVVNRRTGYDLTVSDPATWIKAATGRGTWDDVVTRRALRPEYLSEGLPDLRSVLPLL